MPQEVTKPPPPAGDDKYNGKGIKKKAHPLPMKSSLVQSPESKMPSPNPAITPNAMPQVALNSVSPSQLAS
jgi:hypothetical protein